MSIENIEKEIKQLKTILMDIRDECQKNVEETIDDKLRVLKRGDKYQYYIVKKGKSHRSNGKYIKNENRALAQSIAQRDYDKKLINLIDRSLTGIENFMSYNRIKEIYEVYDKMKEGRRQLVEPRLMSDKLYKEAWEKMKYQPKGFADDAIKIYSENKERVRSKSEKIIADKLKAIGIPYRYEAPITLKGYGIVYPDFTLLDIHNRKEYIWEHFGMMDDEQYIEKAIKKIELYQRNGYFTGDKLIITHETRQRPLDMQVVESMLDTYEIKGSAFS